jgi:ribosomal protein S1
VVKPGNSVNLRILEIDKENRRMSLSLKRAIGAVMAETTAAAGPPVKKKKRPELRGGLDR